MTRRDLAVACILLVLFGCGPGDDAAGPDVTTAGPETPPPLDLVETFSAAVPDDLLQLFMIRFEPTRGTPYAADFGLQLEGLPGFSLRPDDLEAMMIARDERAAEEPGYNNVTIVVRTRTDRTIEQAFRSRIEHTKDTLLDLDLARVQGGFFPGVAIVRLDPRTFLYYRGARPLEDLVRRWREKRPPRLDDRARALLDSARGYDGCILQLPPNAHGESIDAIMARSGTLARLELVRFGEPIEFSGTIAMASDEDAQARLERALKSMEELAAETDPGSARQLEALRAIGTKRHGSNLVSSGSLRYELFEALFMAEGIPVISGPAW